MSLSANKHFQELKPSYLFAGIRKKVDEYMSNNPQADLVRLGIGDVTLPLSPIVVSAMQKAVEEMGQKESFRGYGPEPGYDFLRDAVEKFYKNFGACVNADEVYISEGAKSDVGNIIDIFGECDVVIPDPVYPVYFDSNVICGNKINFVVANSENKFLPDSSCMNGESALIYLCSPNNPTGAAYNREQLQDWVDYANKSKSIIIFDSCYEAFISDENVPHSIFEIPGARTCAIEMNSLSKTAGFTGTRCGWTVISKELEVDGVNINALWNRRQSTKFNGVSYIVQRGAEAAISEMGRVQCMENINYYKENTRMLTEYLKSAGIEYFGGENSPYVWLKCPDGMGSWEYFDKLLNEYQIVGTPGAGFGEQGEGYLRLTSFGTHEDTAKAIARLCAKK